MKTNQPVEQAKPSIGDRVTVRGVACEIIRIYPAGTLDVAAVDANDDRAWRLSGLRFGSIMVEGAIAAISPIVKL